MPRLLVEKKGSNRALFGDLDSQAGHAVAHLAQGKAQAGARGGAVESVFLQRLDEDVALDLVEVGHEVAGQWGVVLERRFGRRGVGGRLCCCRGHRRRWGCGCLGGGGRVR